MAKNVPQGEEILAGLDEALLVLILKKEHPSSISEFIPITLCNVAYKAITKVITNNRLKEVQGELIAPSRPVLCQADIVLIT